MIPCERLFTLGAARACAPARRWRLDGPAVTDGAVRVTSHAVRGLAEGPLWLWLVEDGVRARMVDVPGLLRALARLGEADSGREAETGDRPP